MMDSRREFLKKAALLSGGIGLSSVIPPSIQRAMAINPAVGSTFLDAEHVVILMQENRSFDHCFGSLQGVRGFNDPCAIQLPNKNPVWLQHNAAGETYAPFRLNIKDTKATWMGSLPHSWANQVDARNSGHYDQWLDAKKSGKKEYEKMPLTLGYYTRDDIPFYYSLADAFTVCDQNFCSSLTGTTPNRLYLWTGTIRDEQNGNAKARVRNSELDYHKPAHWTTFPERLEDAGVAWKVYQNEISIGVGLNNDEDAWLANFTDNPLEWFSQYHVRFLPAYMKFLPKKIEILTSELKSLREKISTGGLSEAELQRLNKQLVQAEQSLKITKDELITYTPENFDKLSQREKNIHQKAFSTNVTDPDYHQLTSYTYKDGVTEREIKIPKGDVLHQFKDDVANGKLPTVSWLIAPENFSDHPGAPWYGAWYVSEVMDTLTKNPETWKKTIFILCYDENDGYFDHVPPFVPPHPTKPETGLVSKGIDTAVEYVTLQQDSNGTTADDARESSIGLGYRVPLVIASPWSRGGFVNSQVFDHTSIIQFLETFLSNKKGKEIKESNISAWRRTVCGDLTSVFRSYDGEKITFPTSLVRNDFIASIHKAQFKKTPTDYQSLTPEEIKRISTDARAPQLPTQESGTRLSCALPYRLHADGKLSDDKKTFQVSLQARGANTVGAPFHVYANNKAIPRAYAVAAGDQLNDSWRLDSFENKHYQLLIYGPNGFFRDFQGNGMDPALDIRCEDEVVDKKSTGNIELHISNGGSAPYALLLKINTYQSPDQHHVIPSKGKVMIPIDLRKSRCWYDFTILLQGNDFFLKRYAGRVENGTEGISDPAMA
jgi:phospholipase C